MTSRYKPVWSGADEVMKMDHHVCAHQDMGYATLSQPNEDQILAYNQELRKDPIYTSKDQVHGKQHVANIPLIAWHLMCRKRPEILFGDSKTRYEALMEELRDPVNEPFLVVDRKAIRRKFHA